MSLILLKQLFVNINTFYIVYLKSIKNVNKLQRVWEKEKRPQEIKILNQGLKVCYHFNSKSKKRLPVTV